MFNLIWLLVVILVVAFLLGLGGVFHLAVSLLYILIILAVIFAVLGFLFGGFGRGGPAV